MPINLTCRRLSFGVPLEDVFSAEEIHPRIKALLSDAYENIANQPYTLEDILRRFQGTVQERLLLKDRVILRKMSETIPSSPGALLWVLRHFLGLLPISLLASWMDGRKFSWLELSEECKEAVLNYATAGKNNRGLIKKISKELLCLPIAHFLMTASLFNFLRMLSVLPDGEPRIDKSAAFVMVQYFSSSMFIKPYRPGWIAKIDRQYYPLSLFLILQWPEIRKTCMENSRYRFALPLDEIYEGYREHFQPPECPHYFSKRSCAKSSQTDEMKHSTPRETLIRMVPACYDDFCYLKDVSCQTEAFQEEYFPEFKQEIPSNSTPKPYGWNFNLLRHKYSETILTDNSNNNCSREVDNGKDSRYEEVKTFDPITKQRERSLKVNSKTTNTPQNYSDLRKALNEELKLKLADRSQTKTDLEPSVEEFLENSKNTEVADSKKSLIGMQKLKSKLELLQIFHVKRRKAKKCKSCEQVESKVRYTKMGSVSSLL